MLTHFVIFCCAFSLRLVFDHGCWFRFGVDSFSNIDLLSRQGFLGELNGSIRLHKGHDHGLENVSVLFNEDALVHLCEKLSLVGTQRVLVVAKCLLRDVV